MSLYGVSLGLMNLCFYQSLNLLPLGVAVSIEFIGPLSIAIFSSRKPSDVLWILLSILGLYLFWPSTNSAVPLSALGIVYALLAAIFWASYIIAGKRTSHACNSGENTAVGMLVGTLVILPFGVQSVVKSEFNFHQLVIALIVAVFSSALPYTLEMKALKVLPSKTFSIFLSLDPGVAAILGLIVLKEHLILSHYFGIFCLMVASLGTVISDHNKNKIEM